MGQHDDFTPRTCKEGNRHYPSHHLTNSIQPPSPPDLASTVKRGRTISVAILIMRAALMLLARPP